MAVEAVDPRWPKLLSLTVHEFRTPVTVVAGYLRMLLKDRAGAVTDQQRRLLEEAEKSCGRLSALLSEVSDLANLEAGTTTMNAGTVQLHALLDEVIANLPGLPDRDVFVELQCRANEAAVSGDQGKLKAALSSILAGLRRELVTSDRLFVRHLTRPVGGRQVHWIAIGDAERIDSLSSVEPSALTTFDEWRGGCGLSLAVARRIIDAHHGGVWSPADETKAAAAILLPVAGS